MVVGGPGTIGPHPYGAGMQWRAAGDGFFVSRCKPKAAEKSWRRPLRVQERGGACVAGLRSDQTDRGRDGCGVAWSADEKGKHVLAAVDPRLLRTDEGFAGSFARQGLAFDVKSVGFLRGRHGATSGATRLLGTTNRRGRRGMEEAVGQGQLPPPSSAGRTIRTLLLRSP